MALNLKEINAPGTKCLVRLPGLPRVVVLATVSFGFDPAAALLFGVGCEGSGFDATTKLLKRLKNGGLSHRHGFYCALTVLFPIYFHRGPNGHFSTAGGWATSWKETFLLQIITITML